MQELVSANIREGKDLREVMQKFSEWMETAQAYFTETRRTKDFIQQAQAS